MVVIVLLSAGTLAWSRTARAGDRSLVIAPVDASNTYPEVERKLLAALEQDLRDASTAALRSSGWQVVSTEETSRGLADSASDPSTCLDIGCHLSLANTLHAPKVLSGSLLQVNGVFTLSLRLVDVRSTSIVFEQDYSGLDMKALASAFGRTARQFFLRGNLLSKEDMEAAKAEVRHVIRKTRIDPKSGLRFAYFAGGPLKYGCVPQDTHCAKIEKPPHTVTVPPFWIGVTEVPMSAYQKCIDANVCTAPVSSTLGLDRCNVNIRPDHPANCATWYQARQFCRWIGGDLPTGAMWEFAAKDGSDRIYPWGDSPPTSDHARFATDSTGPVGQLPQGASPAGLLDLAGNVAEWTASDGDLGGYRQIRGGAYGSNAVEIRNSARGNALPDQGEDWIGFRCRL